MTSSVYIHVPFCSALCDYCDFYSVQLKNEKHILDNFVERLLLDAEILFAKYKIEYIPTIYIGGGTPSVLGPDRISRLLKGILSLVPAGNAAENKPKEITLEANPETAGADFLEAACGAGANRLSLGVQTFNEASRLSVRRAGEGSLLPQRLKLAAEYFPGAFSVDLISGLPFQNEETLINDIDRVLEYEPAHISLYALTVTEGTPFYESVQKGQAKLPAEADRIWISGRDHLEKKGRKQYEVSNFCLPGKECLHNIRYWRMENWLALGPAASSTLIDDEEGSGFRYTLSPDTDKWLQREAGTQPPQTEEALDTQTLIKETLLMGFRYTAGPDTELFQRRFGKSIQGTIPQTIANWQKKGLLQTGKNASGKDIIALTKEGLLFLNRFLVEAFTEMDKAHSIS